jgi:excinuclease ABC subunit B
MYCDVMTKSIQRTLEITQLRRQKQAEYNQEHGITPTSVKREILPLVIPEKEEEEVTYPVGTKEVALSAAEEAQKYMTIDEVRQKIAHYEYEMKQAAKELRFEDAAHSRDLMKKYQKIELTMA